MALGHLGLGRFHDTGLPSSYSWKGPYYNSTFNSEAPERLQLQACMSNKVTRDASILAGPGVHSASSSKDTLALASRGARSGKAGTNGKTVGKIMLAGSWKP